jgi:Protein of unknown function (DUF1488)
MFAFPDDISWNETEAAVEFGLRLGEYEGRVFVPRRVIQSLLGARPTPEDCVRYVHLERTGFERVAEAKVRARELDPDANIRIAGRDLRQRKS